MQRDHAGRLPSLTVVLLHEVERYNLLLAKIHSSMENLQKAIKGFIIMSDELENIFQSLITNQVRVLNYIYFFILSNIYFSRYHKSGMLLMFIHH